MRFVRWVFLASLFLANGLPSPFAQESAEWEIESASEESHLSYDPDSGVGTAENGVLIKYKDAAHGEAALYADRITFNQTSGQVTAEGSVTLQRDGQAWSGERLEYNFRTGTMGAANYRTGKSPFFVAGDSLLGSGEVGNYTAEDAYLTTDDVKNPNYRIRAKRIQIVSGKHFVARNAVVYLGKIPVMYLPWLKASLDRRGNRWSITPGYRSLHGGYLLSTYHYQAFTNLSARLNLDYRTRRGVGGGPDLQYDLGRLGSGEVKSYYLRDKTPGKDNDNPIANDRFRFRLSHRVPIRTNFTAKAVIEKLSDARIHRDFFESEYRRNTRPRSFLEIEQLGQNFSLSLLAQPRVNDFYERIERLPEIKLSVFRQQIGQLPLYYESESSAGYLGHRFANANIATNKDFHAARLDTWHQIVLPITFFNWLNVVPRSGGRYTYYTAAHGGSLQDLEEQRRGVFHVGMEANFRASRTYDAVTNRFWALRGLRHIAQPSINYAYIPEPSTLPLELPRFDAELPSLWQLPLQLPDYNSIDSIAAQNVLRLGLRNKLQTKRGPNNTVQPFIDWNLFADWHINPRLAQTSDWNSDLYLYPPRSAQFSDLTSDLDLYPRDWISFHSFVRYSLDEGDFRLANHQVTLLPNAVWRLALGHLYLRDEPKYWYEGNNVFYNTLYYQFNENWGARLSHQYESRYGTLEEQSYTLYRDFRSWTGAFSFRVREERDGTQDYTLAAVLSLKAFPRFGLGEDTLHNSLLYGR